MQAQPAARTESEAPVEPRQTEHRAEPRQTEHRPAEYGPAAHRQTEHRQAEQRQAEHRHAEPRAEALDPLPKRAVERTAVKSEGTPAPHIERGPAREIAPGERIESSLPSREVPSTPTVVRHDAPASDKHEPGERRDPQPREPGVQQVTAEPPAMAFTRPSAEGDVPPAAAPEPAHPVAEAPPRVVLHSVPVQPETIGGDVETASAPPETRGPLPRETSESIIQSLRVQYQRGGGDAVVHIKPEHLGPVSVSLRVENGSVTAVVNAENPAVAEWLKANEHLLRDGLASSGLHLERFAVKRDGQPPDDGRKGWRAPDDRARRRRALEPESTFEITV
jgi:hypothetical protein